MPSARLRVPTGWKRVVARLPIWLYTLKLDWLLGQRFVLINHIGRESGLERKAVVEVVERDPGSATWTVPSGFGTASDWYRNLCRTPDVVIQVGGRRRRVTTRFLPAEEGASIMARYAAAHPGTARKMASLLGFRVDGGEHDYRAMGESIPFVRFEDRERARTG